MIDRTVQPKLEAIKSLDYTHPVETKLKNGTPVYHINAGSQEVLKIEFIFKAGHYVQPKKLVSLLTNKMLSLGTASYSAYEIAEQIDTYGAYLDSHIDKDHASVSLYCLNKHLKKLLPVFHEIICKPRFSETEFKTLINKTKQEHSINLEKVKYLAREHFFTALYSTNHPYGLKLEFDDFDKISLEDISEFYQNYYSLINCKIIISGKFDPEINSLLDDYFNGTESFKTIPEKHFDLISPKEYKIKIKKEGALQSAIRIGKPLFKRNHPDYMQLSILNTVLGGYFGSRLMSNIREDKGYTYGIGSSIISYFHSSFFSISTEVGSEYTLAAIEEIYNELKRIREELISGSELHLVKNYLTGQIIRSLDGPFALSDRAKMIIKHGLPFDYFKKYVQEINSISPQKLIEMANTYLEKDMLIELIVGA